MFLPVEFQLDFPLVQGGYLVLYIPVLGDDSYSNETIYSLSFELNCLETQSPHDLASGQIFLYLCLPRLNQAFSGIPKPKQLIHV